MLKALLNIYLLNVSHLIFFYLNITVWPQTLFCQSWYPLKCFCSYSRLSEYHGVILFLICVQATQIMEFKDLFQQHAMGNWTTHGPISFKCTSMTLWENMPGMHTYMNCDFALLSWVDWGYIVTIDCIEKDGLSFLVWKVKPSVFNCNNTKLHWELTQIHFHHEILINNTFLKTSQLNEKTGLQMSLFVTNLTKSDWRQRCGQMSSIDQEFVYT